MDINSYYKPATLNDVSLRPVKRTRLDSRRTKKMEPAIPTYVRLFDAMKSELITQNPTGPIQTYANLKSALIQFIGGLGISELDVVGTELGNSYYKLEARHLAAMRVDGRNEQAIRDRKSRLKKWHALSLKLQRELAAETGAPSPFQKALLQALPRGITVRSVADQAGISSSAIKRWKSGVLPSHRSIVSVRRLETFLALQPGCLVDLIHSNNNELAHQPPQLEKLAYRVRLARQAANPYRLQVIPQDLRSQWLQFVAYKTAPISLKFQRSTKGRWKVSRMQTHSNKTILKRWYAHTSSCHYVPTANVAWVHVAGYLGWLKNVAQSTGVPDEKLENLVWLTDIDLVGRYIEWRIERSGGKINGGISSLISFILTLIHPVTGYLTQLVETGFSLPTPLNLKDWQSRCQLAFETFKKLKRSLQAVENMSRNPFDPIRDVISLVDPMAALQDMRHRMRIARPTAGTITEAIWGRDILLIQLLMSSPLRLKNLRELTYHTDNSGNLYSVRDGEWRLRIDREDFKNSEYTAKERPFDIGLDTSLIADIKNYLKVFRPLLARQSATHNHLLFLSSSKKNADDDESWVSLSRHVAALTKRYLMKCPGVGTHAIRHIVATAIVKKTGQYGTAARVLNDKESTIEKSYAHLVAEDGHKQYRSLFPNIFSG